jgi:hypothetical protein
MIKLLDGIVAIGCILCASLGSPPTQSQTQDLVLGVNASMGSLSVEQQNAILAELHAAGIHYIRAGIAPDDKGVDFARRAQAQGIRIDWLVQLQYRPGAPSRPWPNAFGVWGGPSLSAADPDHGVHTYPWANDPGNPGAAAGRRERLQKYVLAECRPEGSAGRKPCWITEWGIPNHDASCPPHETNQIILVNETRTNFRPYIAQKRVLGLFYYAWLPGRLRRLSVRSSDRDRAPGVGALLGGSRGAVANPPGPCLRNGALPGLFHRNQNWSKPELAMTRDQMLRREPEGNWSHQYFSLTTAVRRRIKLSPTVRCPSLLK